MKGWQIALLVVGCSALAGTGVYFAVRKDPAAEPRTESDAKGNGEASTAKTPKGSPPAPVLTGRKGKTYRHVAGFTFWYPDGWTVKENGDALEIAPVAGRKTAEGPAMVYAIIGDSVAGQGISTGADPRVAAYLDKAMFQISRATQCTLSRGRGTTTVKMSSGQGALYEWNGTDHKRQAVQVRAYACVLKGWGIALLAIGRKAGVEAADPRTRKIFASFNVGAGQKDAALAGSWRLRSTYSLRNESPFETDWSRAQMVSESQSYLRFNADGTWKRLDKHHMLVGAGGVWLESKEDKTSEGTWNAGDGTLFMLWKDGSWNDFKYRVGGAGAARRLRLVSGKRGEVWAPAK